MDSILFLLAVLGVCVIYHWLMINDRREGPPVGLLRMRKPAVPRDEPRVPPGAGRPAAAEPRPGGAERPRGSPGQPRRRGSLPL